MRLPSVLPVGVLAVALVTNFAQGTSAAEVMCDPSYQDCRALLLSRIQGETQAIDVAMLFMEDDALADAIIARFNAGVRVRLLVEPRRDEATPKNLVILDRLKAAGIPMRAKAGGGMLHWKFMIFDAQNVVELSAANYSDFYFKPVVPYANYTDEGIFFTDQPSLVDSFRRKFDDAWVDPAAFVDFGNITAPLTRRYPLYGIDPDLSFVPFENFATRSVPYYDAETVRIDTIMYKITEARHAEGLMRAAQRGVPVRLITEGERYRNPANIWQAFYIDRLYMAGVQIRNRAHEGFLHQKSTLLYGQATTIFGSANWTNESNTSQYEHNYFTTKAWFFAWFRDNFERKWNNATGNIETAPFKPLPPAAPAYATPANGATGIATSGAALQWNPGSWGWTADIYFGTSPAPPLFAANVTATPGEIHGFALPALNAGTTYYWKIVSKTAALQEAQGAVYSFTTAGTTSPPPPNAAPTASMTSPASGSTFTAPATVAIGASAADSDGTVVRVDFYSGAALLGSDSTSPYQFSWSNVPAGTYTLSARATDNAGATTTSATVSITVSNAPPPPPPPPPPALPAPWNAQDVGPVGPAGSAAAANGTFTVKGAGADVWGTADALQYVWQPISGDVDVVARVASVENVQAWVKAGVMIRERLAPDSPHAFMLVSAAKGIAFQRRVAGSGISTSTAGAFGAAPAWVKLERRAGTISAFQSSDGANWTLVGRDTFTMAASAYVGLAVSSHDATRLATATFDNVRVQAPATAPPPPSLKEIVLYAADATAIAGPWRLEPDSTAAAGRRAWNPDAGTAKVITAVEAPAGYIELTFSAEAGRPYRLWIRGKAELDAWTNDSAHVQFSGSVDAQGTPIYRIGTTASAEYNLESCKGCGLAGWGWEDNGWGVGVLGPVIYFQATGTQTIRLQNREDGLSFDQIVLSAERYFNSPPGPAKSDATILPKN